MAEIKFDSRPIEKQLGHVSNVKEINKCYPSAFKLQKLKENTIPVIPVSVNEMFRYVPAGAAETGTFSDATFPGLFTAGVTGTSAAIFITFLGDEQNSARYFFFHAATADDVRKNEALENAMTSNANVQIVVMVNGESPDADQVLEGYITTLHKMSANDAGKTSGNAVGKMPDASADKMLAGDAKKIPGIDTTSMFGGAMDNLPGGDAGDVTDKMLGNDISKMFGDAGKLLGDDVNKMLGVAGNNVKANIFAWTTCWDTFCVTLSAKYHGLAEASFGHYLPDPAEPVNQQGAGGQGGTTQTSQESTFNESLKDFTSADLQSLMEKIKGIGNK